MSIVPTIPAAWLTFAEGTVYTAYDQAERPWGISITTDQQLAGAIMKTGGSLFLWAIVIFIFFRRVAAGYGAEQDYRRPRANPEGDQDRRTSSGPSRIPGAELTGSDEPILTTADIEREFARSAPARSDSADHPDS
jgi:putative membrane protein